MSALGQKQTYALQNSMSALPPKADTCGATRDVRFGPIADSCSAAIGIATRSPGQRAPHGTYPNAIASAARATGNAQAQSAITDTAAAATRQPTRNPTSNRSEPFNLVNS